MLVFQHHKSSPPSRVSPRVRVVNFGRSEFPMAYVQLRRDSSRIEILPTPFDPGLAIVNHPGLRAEGKFGLQLWEALRTATCRAAKAFFYAKDLGSLEPWKLGALVLAASPPP